MTIYFVGGEMAGFIPSDNSSVEETGATTFDAAFSRCCIEAGDGSASAYIETPALGLPSAFYAHFYQRPASGGSLDHTLVALVTSGGTEIFRVRYTASAVQMQVLVGAVWTAVGASVPVTQSALNHYDLFVDSAGTASLFIAGTERVTASADLSAVTSIDKLRFKGVNSASGSFVSQVIVADEPTIGWRLASYYPSGSGSDTAWTGDFTGVDEIVYSDADFINTSAADQVETFACTGPALTGYTVRAVAVAARAKRGGSGPQNIQLALRSSGTNYFSGNKSLGVGYGSVLNVWETNPATTAAWVSTAISALQPGVKSIA